MWRGVWFGTESIPAEKAVAASHRQVHHRQVHHSRCLIGVECGV
jgi:hypothetical protein